MCVEDIFLKFTKRAKAMGSDAHARKAREGEESPDAPALEGDESPDALKGASYQPSRFRRTITPVVYAPTRGVQLDRIA